MHKKTKKYVINGVDMKFNSSVFNDLFFKKMRKIRMNISETEEKIGEVMGVSSDAVHSWRFSQNSPSNLEMVKKLAEYLDLSNYMLLLEEREKEETVHISGRQQDSLKILYDAIVDYLWEFEKTDGFNGYLSDLIKNGERAEEVEGKLYELADEAHSKVIHTWRREYLLLHKLDIYESLKAFVCDDLREIYTGKLGFASRLVRGTDKKTEASVSDEYMAVLRKINELMDPYLV